jgi:hypothetical protein
MEELATREAASVIAQKTTLEILVLYPRDALLSVQMVVILLRIPSVLATKASVNVKVSGQAHHVTNAQNSYVTMEGS